jgi:hypothetical protein
MQWSGCFLCPYQSLSLSLWLSSSHRIARQRSSIPFTYSLWFIGEGEGVVIWWTKFKVMVILVSCEKNWLRWTYVLNWYGTCFILLLSLYLSICQFLFYFSYFILSLFILCMILILIYFEFVQFQLVNFSSPFAYYIIMFCKFLYAFKLLWCFLILLCRFTKLLMKVTPLLCRTKLLMESIWVGFTLIFFIYLGL